MLSDKKNIIQDIFRLFSDNYEGKYYHCTSKRQLKVLRSVRHCRSSLLGGHIYECDQCGKTHIQYNSCRDRHCPICQGYLKRKWLAERRSETLPVPYFHIVFTVPQELNPLIYSNKRIGYDLLFKSAIRTLSKIALDKKHLGARIGGLGILHTWGEKMVYHPHIHFLVPGGGLSINRNRWIQSRDNFFLPVKVLSTYFKNLFLSAIRIAVMKEKMVVRNKDKLLFQLKELKKKKWVVYSKEPLNNPNKIIDYFGRYTHRVAISNYRIQRFDDEKVYFKYKDYRNNKKASTHLNGIEFIRRFLQHVLPKRFTKIRYFGFLSNGKRKKELEYCRSLLKDSNDTVKNQEEIFDWENQSTDKETFDYSESFICPYCKKGKMIIREKIPVRIHSPPTGVYYV